MEVIGVFLFIAWLVGALFVMRWYYVRRHGIGLKHYGNDFTIDHFVAAAIAVYWPITILIPVVRNPPLCTHSSHVFARQQSRQQADAYQEALRSEREGW